MNGTTNGTDITLTGDPDVDRYVTVSYLKMKRPAYIEVVSSNQDEDGTDSPQKPRSRSFIFGRSFSTDENDNNGQSKLGPIAPSIVAIQNQSLSSSLPELVSHEPEPAVDVAIVGAGLSGLTAAYQIRQAQPDLSLVVLEAKENVGGRTYSPMLNTATGTRRFDLGDQWVNTDQRTILELLDKLNLETYPEYKEGKNILIHADGESEEFEGNIYPINPFRRLDISSFVSRIESMREDLSKKDPTDLSESLEWDSITLEQFKKEHIWTDEARQVFDALVVFHFGVTPREMSLLFFCHVLNSVGGWKVLFGENQEFPVSRQLKIKGGAQQVCENLATEIDRANIRLNDPVTIIDQTDDELVNITTDSGCRYRAKRVIMATSVDNSVRIQHKPSFPPKRSRMTKLMPAGHCIKYVVTYENAFWRKDGMSGHVIKLTDEEQAFDNNDDLMTYEYVFDACSCNRNPNVTAPENPALMGMIFSESLRQLTKVERKKILLKKLAEIYGDEALKTIDYAEMDWGLDRYTNGYPFSSMMPGAMVYHAKGIKKPHGRIHWCGAEMSSSWYGYMEGSVKSGKRVASEVRKALNTKITAEKQTQQPVEID
ncbi:probable flavin-containing monoamine oxidase A isoform X1 [Strongylocentrotus purpuratus]|uniref:Amine oxidase n=1 Tax=Strongylocentrotus purpuratus TaxID=7668 RepID=A0A7M7GGP8_STRPU|nr:probable flavin-containing monoamine oxidase A isoform X1 [Strongylocentrotus purpuratus]|eukprot:XP_003726162.2 PREDICTED: probable flavin-containing monoamine oxidase A isoform X1 [Strongylocentrotus purpuratus]